MTTGRPVRTAIQLYSIREFDEPLTATLERVGETAFDGVEFAHRLPNADDRRVAEVLDRTNLTAAGAHVGLEELSENLPAVVDRHRSVSTRRAVVPHVPASEFEDPATVRALADRLNATGERLSDEGLSLLYHNQDHDFVPVGERNGFETLLAETDPELVDFELDVGGAVAAGEDPVELLARHGDRIPLVHVKDVDAPNPEPGGGQSCVPIGEGDVDVDGVVRAAIDADVEWVIYENDDPDDPARALDRGAAALDDAVRSASE